MVSSVVPYPARSGGQKRTLRLLDAILRAGVEPHLVVGSNDGDRSAEASLTERGVHLDVVDPGRQTLGRRLAQHAKRLPSPYLPDVAARIASVRARHPVAFVQFEHTQNAYYFGAAAGLRTVLSLHNVDSELVATLARSERHPLRALRHWNRWNAMRRVERRAARSADAVLCVSEPDASVFDSLGAEVVVVPNGVDDDLFQVDDRAPESDRVLFFGQLDYAPNAIGIRRFVREGWPLVLRRRPAAQLRLAGSGIDPDLRRELLTADRVEPLGFVESIEAELETCSAVVVPIWQGGGTRLKVLESMAAARPVAGTPLGISGVGFRDREHGFVAESPRDLALAVCALLEDRALARRLAIGGRELADRFRWPAVTRPAERLYRLWGDRVRAG